jgi:plastocyanin
MRFPIRRLAAATLALATLVVLSCSKDDNKNPVTPGLELNSGNIVGAATFAHVFASAGSYPYHCTIHPQTMNGTVTVTAGTADPASVNVSIINMTTGFAPATVSVRAGGTVTWTNNDGITHTVTSK